jgi:hypothetical protein
LPQCRRFCVHLTIDYSLLLERGSPSSSFNRSLLLFLLLLFFFFFFFFFFLSVLFRGHDSHMKGTLRQCRVFVQVESGEKHMVLAYDHETVWQLKQRVFEVTDVMPHQQQLFRVGKKETKELENTKLLSKSKVKNGSQLSMLVDKPEEGNLVSPRPSESVAPAALSPRKPASAVSVPRLPSLAGLHPASCFAFGTGLRQAIAGYQTAFCVYLCTQRGVQIGAADAIAEGCVEVLVSGTPADVVLSARADGVLEVSYTAFSATNDANIDVKVDGVSIGNCEGGQMGLEVREGEAGRLVETAGWAGAALEALAGEAERSGSLASLGPAPLTPFSALKAPALLPLQRGLFFSLCSTFWLFLKKE